MERWVDRVYPGYEEPGRGPLHDLPELRRENRSLRERFARLSSTSTTVTGLTNRNSTTGGWKAPAIQTGIADAEDCDYTCEQEVLEARNRHNRGETSEEEQQDEVCTAIAWQTGHQCGE